MKKIVFLSRAQAQRLKATDACRVIISIHDISEPPAELDPSFTRLTLCFHDTDGSIWVLQLFTPEMALLVLEFLDKYRDTTDVLIVHCSLGQSRSAAIAMMLSEVSDVPCYKENLPVSYANYKIYNKFVYRVMTNVAHEGSTHWWFN